MTSTSPGYLVGRSPRGLLPHALRATYWSARGRWWQSSLASAERAARVGAVTGALRRHGIRPEWRILDLGCGTGAAALAVAELGCRVVGLDLSAGMLRRTQARAAAHPQCSLALVRSDFEAGLALRPACFDAVICMSTLHCATRPASLLADIGRVLHPARGLLLLLVVSPRGVADLGRGLPGRIFAVLRRLPGWRRRLQIRSRAELGMLLGQADLGVVEDVPVGPDLLLVARRVAVA